MQEQQNNVLTQLAAPLGNPGEESPLFFVYGTLKRGWGNHGRLEGAEFVGSAVSTAGYVLYHSGFPIATPMMENGRRIRGEIFRVKDPMSIRGMDALEGHPGWYERQVRTFVLDEDGKEINAWIYEMTQDRLRGTMPQCPVGEDGIQYWEGQRQ